MNPRVKLIATSPVLRWSLLAVVIAVAVAVAVWPRTDDSGDAQAAAPRHSAAEVAAARRAAALPGCASGHGAATSGPLAGTTVGCLGTGEPLDMGAVLGGRPTLVNVWASWCQPCRQELPVLDRYAAGDGIRVVEVQVSSNAYDGLTLLHRLGVRLPTVHDRDGRLAAALHLPKGLPASYLVDAGGTPHLIGSPRVFTSVSQVRQAVDARVPGSG